MKFIIQLLSRISNRIFNQLCREKMLTRSLLILLLRVLLKRGAKSGTEWNTENVILVLCYLLNRCVKQAKNDNLYVIFDIVKTVIYI